MLNHHFPDSIHEDILGATHLEHLQTAKPKRDPKFREDVLRVYGYRCVICGFDLRLDNAPLAVDAAHIRWHQAHGQTAASGSNPFYPACDIVRPERVPISPFSPRRFSHLVVWEIPAPEIENVFFSILARKPQAGCEFMKNARIAHKTW